MILIATRFFASCVPFTRYATETRQLLASCWLPWVAITSTVPREPVHMTRGGDLIMRCRCLSVMTRQASLHPSSATAFEGRPRMSDVFPLSGSQGCHLIPLSYLLSFFCLSFHFFGLFICVCASLMMLRYIGLPYRMHVISMHIVRQHSQTILNNSCRHQGCSSVHVL